jgi:type VI secretion system secreted protein VgrG
MALIAELIFNAPGGAKMQLLSMSGTEGLSKAFEYQVEILCDKPDLDLKTFLGKSMTVAVEQPAGGTRYFNGLIARFVQSGRKTKHFYHYQATLRPWFWFLSRTQDCKIFQEKTVVQIVEEVFGDHTSLAKFKKSLNASYTPWVYCVQYRESDMNFVARMMEQEGLYYYFEHTKNGHEMVLCDNASAHRAVTNYKEIPYEANWAARETITECITSWGASVQVLPTKVVLADFDFERPSMALRKDHTVSRTHDMASFEVFDYPGEYTQDGDGVAYAKVRAQEQQASFQLIAGQTDSRGVSCGFTFKATGMSNSTHNQEYLVVSTSVYVEEGVQIGGEDAGNAQYSCDFQVMPTSDTFRAARVTPKPMVHGPQTAKVVGPSGEHIHTDKYGRVKVQFHWDRIGAKNDKSSCWMRVSQPWAGNGFGIISIPRIGDEVVVSFLEGDPDQPIITGRVYNAEFMPPYALPEHNHITSIFTRSVGSNARAEGNELKFCDKPGNEYILVQAQKDFHREVENDDHDRVKANQFLIVDGNREEKVAGTMDVTVAQTVKTVYGMDHQHDLAGDNIASIGGVYELKVGGEHKMDVGGDAGVTWGGKGQLDVAQDLAMSSGGNVDIKGAMNVTIQAGTTLTLKAGGCSIVLGPGSISIDGPMVNINCGGSGSAAQKAAPAKPADPIKAKEPEQKQNPHP